MTTSAESEHSKRIDRLETRMDKYDEIISDLKTIVIALKAKSDASQRWTAMMLTIGATLVGGSIGAILTHIWR